jgi:dTDP-glucose 4,6-dehydratase
MGVLLKIIVTGGAGFIGSHFIRKLLQDSTSYSVVAIDSLTYAGNRRNLEDLLELPNFSFLHRDICDPNLPNEIFFDADSIVNFAAESHVDRSINSSSEFVNSNIVGTHNLLKKSYEAGISKFLQVSTDEVYGSISSGSWDEESKLLPNSPYAASKASADLLVRSFNKTYGLHTNITRCSNNFGTHQYPEKLIPVIINNLLSGKSIPIYGDGLNKRDWLHVQDHCDAIELVLLQGSPGEIYNIGGGTEITNLELTKRIVAAMGMSEDRISFVEDRKGHDFRYSVAFKKIQNELGYAPSRKLNDSLEGIIDWYRENQDWWK